MTQDTEKLLEERGRTHGEYSEHAQVTQAMLDALMRGRNWKDLPDIMKETLHMNCHKAGRIVTGNPFLVDHWADTEGYTRLVVQRIVDGVGLRPEYDIGRDLLFGETDTSLEANPFTNEGFDLTEQGRLVREEPERAKFLRARASAAGSLRIDDQPAAEATPPSVDKTIELAGLTTREQAETISCQLRPGTPEDGGQHAARPVRSHPGLAAPYGHAAESVGERVRGVGLGPDLISEDVLERAISHALNCEGIDSRASESDWKLAQRLRPHVTSWLRGESGPQMIDVMTDEERAAIGPDPWPQEKLSELSDRVIERRRAGENI